MILNENEMNSSNSQQIPKQILQSQLKSLQRTNADKSVDEGTSATDSRGKSIISSSSESGHGYRKEIQDENA